jgi:hypothetical protein
MILRVLSPNTRYEGKPFLKLLDAYVLWAIDELSEANAQTLKDMTPKLRSVYGVEGEWQEIVSAVMELPPNMSALIRDLWTKNTDIARKNGVTLAPSEFAETFVDCNLVR